MCAQDRMQKYKDNVPITLTATLPYPHGFPRVLPFHLCNAPWKNRSITNDYASLSVAEGRKRTRTVWCSSLFYRDFARGSPLPALRVRARSSLTMHLSPPNCYPSPVPYTIRIASILCNETKIKRGPFCRIMSLSLTP